MNAVAVDNRGNRAPKVKSRRTVVYTHGGGRLGNQLLRFVHLLAWATEHRDAVQVVNLAFAPFARGWRTWGAHPGCSYPRSSPTIDRWVSAFLALPAPLRRRLDWRIQRLVHRRAVGLRNSQALVAEDDFDGGKVVLGGAAFMNRIEKKDTTYLAGWRIEDWSLLAKHESTVRQLMLPDEKVLAKAERTVELLRNEVDVVITLHIRRGDYREFDGGRFHYEPPFYREWAQQLPSLYPDKRIGLLLCGDESIDESEFEGSPVPWVLSGGSVNRGGSPIDSLIEMSLSDLIVGPPSTFSAFAAFLGAIPMLPLGSVSQRIDRGDLVVGNLAAARVHPVLSSVIK